MQVRETPPFAPVLMESTRAIGYSLEAAIADIIDNSVAAKAGKVQLSFFPVGDAYVSILDNGTGMDDAQMNIAMQYGSKSPTETRDSSDLGRYGLGLKTASLSQCRVLTVISKQGDQVIGRRWDLDYVIKTGAWSLLILDKEDIGIQGLPQRWIRFLTRSSICLEIRKVKNLFSAADWCWVMSNPAKPQITQQSATKLLILGTELLLFLQE